MGTEVHLVEKTIKYHPVAPPFQQIFLPPRFWVFSWPAATRVSVPTTKGSREETPSERGCILSCKHASRPIFMQGTPSIQKSNVSISHPLYRRTERQIRELAAWPGNQGQKLKIQKRCEKRLYDHIRVVVCNKPLQKTPNIRKITAFWKWPKLAKMHRLLPMQNAQLK